MDNEEWKSLKASRNSVQSTSKCFLFTKEEEEEEEEEEETEKGIEIFSSDGECLVSL